MKRIYLLVLLSICLSLSVFANGVEIDGIYYLLDSTDYTASVTYTGSDHNGNNSYAGDVVIPSSIDYNNHPYCVTNIGDYAFYECVGLTSVTFDNSVTSIGELAFYDCSGLTAIEIPNSVTSISNGAFGGCNHLSVIYISDLAAWCTISFGNYAANPIYHAHNLYLDGNLLTDLVIPESVTRIENFAFYGCDSLSSVIIPDNVTDIRDYAFNGCTGITSAYIGNGVSCIGKGAFNGCNSLTSIEIPNSVTSIGERAFNRCKSLISVTIGNSVTSIETSTFSGCTGLTSVIIGNSIASIGSEAFSGCSNLTLITLPNSVTNIGGSAFSDCTSLTYIAIPNGVTNIENNTFYSCFNLTFISIPNSITNIGLNAFRYCKLDTVVSYAIHPPVVGGSSFRNMTGRAILCVPYESIEAYKAISGYADYFAEIKGFSDVEDITATTATLKWIPDTTVMQYNINIYTADTLFAHYVVDGDGNITSSQRFAPSIYHQKLDTTTSSTEVFVISLNGLSAGTDYNYTIDGTNSQSAPIYHEEGSFTTMSENEVGLFDIISDDPRKQAVKLLRDGQIYIMYNGTMYNVQGQKMK